MTTYLDLIQKIQAQTLENVKQIQSVQISTLKTAREIVAALPTLKGMPTFEQITEFGSNATTQMLNQQKTFVSELSEVVTPESKHDSLVKSSSN